MILKRDLYKTAYKSLALKICGSGINFLLGILIARTLGASDFGVYSVVLSLTVLFGLLSSLGLSSYYTRETAIFQSNGRSLEIHNLYKSTAKLVTLTSLFFILLAAGLVYYGILGINLTDLSLLGWILVFLIIPFYGVNLNRAGILRGLGKIISADLPEILIKPTLVLSMIIVSMCFNVSVAVSQIVYFQFFACIVVFFMISKFISKELDSSSFEALESNKKYHSRIGNSWVIFLLISLLTILQTQMPLYMASVYIDAKSAGLYQSCILIVNVLALGLTAVNSPLQPKLAAAWHRNDILSSQQLIGMSVRLASILAIVFMIVIYFSSNWVLGFYGEEFVGAENTLIILLFGQLINAFCGPCALLLIMANKQNIVLWVYSISIILGVVIALILVPKYELDGIALATFAMIATWNIVMTYLCAKKLKVKTLVFQNLTNYKGFGVNAK